MTKSREAIGLKLALLIGCLCLGCAAFGVLVWRMVDRIKVNGAVEFLNENVDMVVLAVAAGVLMLLLGAWSKQRRVGLLSVAIASLVVVGVLIGGSLMMGVACDRTRESLRQALVGIAPTYAAEMQARGHWRLPSGAAADDALYLELIEAEKRWLLANPGVADVYTFRRTAEGEWHLIVDSETDYDHSGAIDQDREVRTHIGTAYEDMDDELNAALGGAVVFMDEPETDEWGTWVTALAPVRSDAGTIEAVLGVDFPAAEWTTAIVHTRLAVISYVAVILILVMAGTILNVTHLHQLRLRNITEAKAREADEFLRNTIDSLSAHTVVIGSDGRIRSANRAWVEFAAANGGAGPDALEGGDYLAVCDRAAANASEAVTVGAAIRAVLAGEAAPATIEYPCDAPNEKRWFMCSIRGFSLKDERFAVISHLNITAIKLAELELTQANESLAKAHAEVEERVEQRTAQLVVATEAAQAASKAKSEFLATMSHEIRTPLNGVVGTLELLAGSTLSEQQKRYTQIGKTSALTLTSVINDILDFSKIEAGKLELSPVEFDLRRTVGDVMEMLAVRASEKGLEVACGVEPTLPVLVRGDPERLRQILINLVNNAVKFTQRGAITLRVAAVGGGTGEKTCIRFSVTDTGIGVPKDRLDRLFKAFSQTDASFSRKYGGTGLGLAICKQLAELMGGSVGVESEPGVGSTFWFEAVLPTVHAAAGAPMAPAAVDCGNLRLLVVEDHDVQREFIAECLSALRFSVDTAADGEAALAMLLEADAVGRPFAAVLTDHEMPGMDGIEVAVAMQSRPELAGIPVILLSSALDLDPARVRAASFASHLTKPLRQSMLFDAVMTAVASKSGATTHATSVEPAASVETPLAVLPNALKPRTRVLLAEDNEINQLIACELLSKSGFDCTVAANGVAAVAAVAKEPYDLVLMDCQMPEMDGFEATREIRRLEQAGTLVVQQGRRLPIIALTANALKGDRERCLDAGMDAYSTKPIDLKQLKTTIDSLMSAQAPVRQAA